MSFTIQNLFKFISMLIVVWNFLPLLSNNFPIGLNYPLAIIWFFLILTLNIKTLLDRNVLNVLAFGVILFAFWNLFLNFDTEWKIKLQSYNSQSLWQDFYSMILSFSIFAYYYHNEDNKSFSDVGKLSIACIMTTAILTIIVSFIYPEYSRDILVLEYNPDSISIADTKSLLYLKRFGAGTRGDGFGFMMLCIFCGYVLNNYERFKLKISKTWIWFTLAICFFALVRMAFATLLIYTFFFTLLSIININYRSIVITIGIVFLLIYIFVPIQTWANLMYDLGNFFGKESSLGARFNDIGVYIEFGNAIENGVSNRADVRYSSAFEAFLSAPILGIFSLDSSDYGRYFEEHLFFMNKLVTLGLLLFSWWCYLIYYYANKLWPHISRSFRYHFIIIFVCFLSYGLIKVIIVRQAWLLLFAIMPAIYCLIEKDEEDENANIENDEES